MRSLCLKTVQKRVVCGDDDVIFTQSTNPVPTYLKINAQNSQVVSPLNGENRYFFSVDVTDQYNNLVMLR